MTFRDWIFSRLPAWYKEADTYKDNAGEGLLERFCRNFGLELDEEYVEQIDDYTYILDPLTTDSKFINLIAYQLGSPPDFLGNDSLYRRFLSIILQVYKIKGTRAAYRMLFALIGWDIELLIYYPRDVIYDSDYAYDSGVPQILSWLGTDGTWILPDGSYWTSEMEEGDPVTYDDNCNTCVPYIIFVYPQTADCAHPELTGLPNITADLLTIFRTIICFTEPINAKLMAIIPTIPICEVVNCSISEEITITIEEVILYDDEHDYDNDEDYGFTPVSTTTITWP